MVTNVESADIFRAALMLLCALDIGEIGLVLRHHRRVQMSRYQFARFISLIWGIIAVFIGMQARLHEPWNAALVFAGFFLTTVFYGMYGMIHDRRAKAHK